LTGIAEPAVAIFRVGGLSAGWMRSLNEIEPYSGNVIHRQTVGHIEIRLKHRTAN